MRILHISPCFVDLSNESGGVANVISNLAREQKLAGHEVTIACTTTELSKQVAKEDIIIHEGISVIVFRQYNISALGPIFPIIKYIEKNYKKFDIAHVHTCFSAFTEAAMYKLDLMNIPFVFTAHGKLQPAMLKSKNLFKKIWWNLFSKRFILKSEKFIALANAEVNAAKEILFDFIKYEVVPNGYTKPEIISVQNIYNKPYILYLGYLEERKQPDLLIRAFSQSISSEFFQLILVGPDKYGFQRFLEKTISDKKINDKVVLHGPAFGEEKWSLLKGASLMCLPSKGEGLPLVLCEALGVGLPCLISDECNFDEIGKSKSGLVLNNFDESNWAKSLDEILLNQTNFEMMRCNSLKLGQNYSWKSIANMYHKIYLEVL